MRASGGPGDRRERRRGRRRSASRRGPGRPRRRPASSGSRTGAPGRVARAESSPILPRTAGRVRSLLRVLLGAEPGARPRRRGPAPAGWSGRPPRPYPAWPRGPSRLRARRGDRGGRGDRPGRPASGARPRPRAWRAGGPDATSAHEDGLGSRRGAWRSAAWTSSALTASSAALVEMFENRRVDVEALHPGQGLPGGLLFGARLSGPTCSPGTGPPCRRRPRRWTGARPASRRGTGFPRRRGA
ncbi:MAG: hypothetical protein MZV64_68095 [Ignavibacteriales bacterium]|nr:hypothetical protein [Ignavibacteriales bacterium]